MNFHIHPFRKVTPRNITLVYILFGAAWTLFTDFLLDLFISNQQILSSLQMLKGWLFVLITAVLMYYMIDFGMSTLRRSEQELQANFADLEATHEELVATEEELSQQFAEIQAAESRFRRIYEGVSSGVVIQNPAGEILQINRAGKNLLGLSYSQLTLKKPPPESWKAEYADGSPFSLTDLSQRHASLDPESLSAQICITFPDGEKRWLKCFADQIIDPDSGSLIELVTTLEDISLQKKFEIEEELTKKQLEESQERYREIFENMSNAVAVYTVSDKGDFIVQEFNRAAENLEGFPRENILGHTLYEAFPAIEGLDFSEVLKRVMETGQPELYPLVFYQKGRISSWRENYIYKLANGEIVVIYRDITARKQAEEALWLEKERAQVTLESIGDGVITTDVHGRIEYLNPVASDLTGWRLEEAKGLELGEVFRTIDETTNEPAENPVTRCLQEGRIIDIADQAVLVHRDGYQFAIEDSAAPIRDREGTIIGAVLAFHDVSDKRSLLHQMTYQAHHDALTGLPNRILFNDRLSLAIAHARRKQKKAAVLFLDIDRFKLVNDTLGHASGDSLLKAVSERLKHILRQGDTIARQGGDEFIILLPDVDSNPEAGIVAQKILEVFVDPFTLGSEEVFVTPSIGISLYPTDGKDIESLIKHADTAMYYAKESGRNNFQFFTAALNTTAQERLEIERSLRRALEKEEFAIHYQPVMSLGSGRIVAVEALVRWHHPHKGIIPPGQFIPVAEDTGLIIPLGEWVLRTACLQASAWQKLGYPLRVAVNLSARQFRQPNLVETIQKVIADSFLEPECLELEITESIAAQDIDFTISILNDLKAMGIHISIDDFGTGFSSLSYLRRFPIDTLKIDKSFVNDMKSKHGDDIVAAIIDLAQNLRLKVIAEGVETEEQLAFLRSKRCDEIQGYLLCKPLPSPDLEMLLFNPPTPMRAPYL